MSVYLIVILAYFTLVILVSVLTKKVASRSAADFLVAGRNLGLVACAVVVAAEWLGGMSTIGVSEMAFTTGTMQPILYNISTALGMVIIGFTVASHYRKNNVHTVSEMIETIFGKKSRNVSAIAFLFAYVVLAFVQLQTCSSVIATLFSSELESLVSVSWMPGDEWLWAVILSSIVITIYTYMGGMHALAITGIIHVAVMFIGLGIALFTGLKEVDGLSSLHQKMVETGSPENLWNPFSGGLSYAWMLVLGGVLGGMAGQASIQPIFAARDVSIARKAAILSAFIVAPFGIMVAILGLIARTGNYFDVSAINAKMVLPTLMTSPEFIHPALGGLALAGVLAAILSTVGPVNFAVVTIATKDIYNGIINPGAADSGLISTARRLVILVNLVTIPLAYLGRDGAILDTAYVSYGIRAIGAIVIIMGIYASGWVTSRGVRAAFIGGTAAVILNIIAKRLSLFSIEDTYVAVVTTIIIVITDYLLARLKRTKQL
ncbi:MAG: sodium:solute symporter family protein [Bacteroidales bacterium]|jgi:SSS family solute:Na+ symporter|nr:sodium:solute symporter family protein [Bacteroidales bacterium]